MMKNSANLQIHICIWNRIQLCAHIKHFRLLFQHPIIGIHICPLHTFISVVFCIPDIRKKQKLLHLSWFKVNSSPSLRAQLQFPRDKFVSFYFNMLFVGLILWPGRHHVRCYHEGDFFFKIRPRYFFIGQDVGWCTFLSVLYYMQI